MDKKFSLYELSGDSLGRMREKKREKKMRRWREGRERIGDREGLCKRREIKDSYDTLPL